jgi:hypothetical protein
MCSSVIVPPIQATPVRSASSVSAQAPPAKRQQHQGHRRHDRGQHRPRPVAPDGADDVRVHGRVAHHHGRARRGCAPRGSSDQATRYARPRWTRPASPRRRAADPGCRRARCRARPPRTGRSSSTSGRSVCRGEVGVEVALRRGRGVGAGLQHQPPQVGQQLDLRGLVGGSRSSMVRTGRRAPRDARAARRAWP